MIQSLCLKSQLYFWQFHPIIILSTEWISKLLDEVAVKIHYLEIKPVHQHQEYCYCFYNLIKSRSFMSSNISMAGYCTLMNNWYPPSSKFNHCESLQSYWQSRYGHYLLLLNIKRYILRNLSTKNYPILCRMTKLNSFR